MFQYAVGRALAIKHNVPLALDVTFLNHRIKISNKLRPNFSFRNYDLDVFNIQADIATRSQISFWNRPIFSGQIMLIIDALLRKLALFSGWEKSFGFDKRVLELGPNTYLEGFWQSEKYFAEITSTLRKEFTLKTPLTGAVNELWQEIENTESVCVFIRKMHGGGGFHGEYDLAYYEKGIEEISKTKKIGKIYVFSDNKEWCKKNVVFSYPTMFVDNSYAGEKYSGELITMSKCKHFVISNSTFAWWSAWLSENPDKVVVAPKKWFVDSSIDTSDLIPEDWIRI